ncbi:aminopeptidase P family protein [Actinomadura barringtoniae]|uniref:Aminopeptidase P family protein n=1 Tax=Actinomadura barringtoniae TaxID=1427535 RepID=A0A939TDM2_9ACTN|nr:Xaa-Pro peptidase family protein [Actinomadura barringtoniae]MBO2455752.1 aminopeptidase P family protein [Actinomadura barringtoniae]
MAGPAASNEIARRLAEYATEAGLDAIVCLSPENVAYAAGFVIPSQPLMRWRHAAHIVTADAREAIVCVDMEESTVRAARPDLPVRGWAEFTGDPMAALADQLRELGLAGGTIGMELGYLSVTDHGVLADALAGAALRPADDLITRARRLKTPRERDLLARLSRISDQAIGDSLRAVRAGDTEMDIAAALTRSVYEQGAQQFKLMIVATGERSQLPNVGPTTRVLEPGDVCRVEIFSVLDGYQAGVCRTAVVGEAPPEAERIYQNLVKCKYLVREAIRPGAAARDVYATFLAEFEQLGMPPISFVGHSIGVNLHERPYLGPHATETLEAGMVLGMEPLVYRSGHGFGMQIKDMVSVEEDGCHLLSDVTGTDELFRIEA